MINSVKVFNADYGDCSLITNENTCMLVDCGSKSNIKRQMQIANEVSKELVKYKTVYLLISHFHRDHYSCIKYIKNVKFEEVYLPNYIFSGAFEIYIASLSFCSAHLKKQILDLLSIPDLLNSNNLIDFNTKIHFVNEGYSFINKLDTFDVLLPRIHNINASNLLSVIVDNEEIKRLKEIYIKSFEINSDNSYSYVGGLSEFNEKLEEFLNSSSSNLFNYKNQILSEYKKMHNKLSIVFQNNYVFYLILFCGDAVRNEIKKVNHKFKLKYKVVKIQHHGSLKNYFYNKMPLADNFIINNKKQQNYGGITYKYDDLYGKTTRFICTNSDNCVKYNNHIPCNSKLKCNAVCGISTTVEIK